MRFDRAGDCGCRCSDPYICRGRRRRPAEL